MHHRSACSAIPTTTATTNSSGRNSPIHHSRIESNNSTSGPTSSPTLRKNTNLELEMGGNVVGVNAGRNHYHLHYHHSSSNPPHGHGQLLMEPAEPVPGRPRRWKKKRTTRHHHSKYIFPLNSLQLLWRKIQHFLSSLPSSSSSVYTPKLGLAILAWYTLGVLSISTSKLLLSPTSSTGIARTSPLTLTFQQCFIGMTVLRILIAAQEYYYDEDDHSHKNPQKHPKHPTRNMYHHLEQQLPPPPTTHPHTAPSYKSSSFPIKKDSRISSSSNDSSSSILLLWKASACFALGFYATNVGFAGSAASFVETIKAAEPITSAAVAVAYHIETMDAPQQISLGTIVIGVLASTWSNNSANSYSNNNTTTTILQTRSQSFMAGGIVMISNLCFSFRGLYQKLFRKQEIDVMDDLNLQYRMQRTGVLLFVVPVILQHLLFPSSSSTSTTTTIGGSLGKYWLLALVNGCAFTCYNLASTYILSRISVVHHAAINCIRRVFAIVVTSILFGVPITLGGGIGIALAVVGFLSYTHFKIQQQQSKQPTSTQPMLPPVSSLLPVSTHVNNQHNHYNYK